MAPSHQQIMSKVLRQMSFPHELIMNYLGKKFGSVATYEAKKKDPVVEQNPLEQAMKVLGYDPSPFAAKLSNYESNILSSVEKAKKMGYDVTPSFIKTILSLESSALENKENRNPKIGEYAWIAGLTDQAKQDLHKIGFKPDLNSLQGALDAAAIYAGQRMSVYDYDPKTNTKTLNPITDVYKNDPGRFYAERYNAATSSESPERQQMIQRANALHNFFNQPQ